MSLSTERSGKFTASEIYRLMAANGQVDAIDQLRKIGLFQLTLEIA